MTDTIPNSIGKYLPNCIIHSRMTATHISCAYFPHCRGQNRYAVGVQNFQYNLIKTQSQSNEHLWCLLMYALYYSWVITLWKDTYLVDFSEMIQKKKTSELKEEIAKKCEKIVLSLRWKNRVGNKTNIFCIFMNFIQRAIEIKVAWCF